MEAKKPTLPKLTPITGTSEPRSFASVRSIVPSPPSATASSALRGSSTSVTPARSATALARSTAPCTSMRPCVTRAAVLTGRDRCVDPLVEVIGKRRVVGLREVEKELPVALRAGETGVYDSDDVRSEADRGLRHLAQDACVHGWIPDDSSLPDVGAPRLELRLDEHDRLPAPRRQPERRRQGHPHGDERDVADDELRRERQVGQRACIRALEDDDARIATDAFVQLAVADVERDHARRAALQQHIGEPAGRRADVEAIETGRIDDECV